ncbi:MAG TPA: class I SAM-dependent methyltransferase [Thermoanaerobaculia bacterium]|nr:class I SAM-dependent methyltransferase [Thermoanaerobaculia bacterium]
MRFRSLAVATLVSLLAALSALAQSSRREYMGRPIAEVMTYHGAPWLERPDRRQEEDTDRLLALLPIEPGDRVADLGCGSGYFARRMAARVGAQGAVLCVDIQPEMLAIARRLAEQEGVENVETVLSGVADPKLEPGSVDLILLVDVYHELSDPAAMLAKMREALAPEGRVALVEYRLEGSSAAHIKLDHRMSVEQVKKEWEPAGFELVALIEELPTQHLFLFARRD